MHPPAIFLMGPTASGKTGLAVELAQRLPVELISVDSALVYRGMDIGSAKPDQATLARAPHHLIDLIAPTLCSSFLPPHPNRCVSLSGYDALRPS